MRNPTDDTWLSPDEIVRQLGWELPRTDLTARSYDSLCEHAAHTYWTARARQQGDTRT